MNIIKAIQALGPIDAKSIHRDSMLRWVMLFPILIAVVLRWVIPAISAYIFDRYQFDLSPYYVLLMSFITLTMPLMIGMVIGFLLLDQRDDHTLTALQVTPLSLNGYLVYRISMPMLISTIISMIVLPLTGLVEMDFGSLSVAIIAAAPIAPIVALFLGSFAQNKVQGFAISKGSSVILIPPLAAFFVSSNWQWAFGLAPTYWPVKLFRVLHNSEPYAWFYLIIGLAYQFLLISILLRRFDRVMHS